MTALPLAVAHRAQQIAVDAHRTAQQRREAAVDSPAALLPTSPAGRRALRGIPCVGTGGLDERRDPLLELLDQERDAEARAWLSTLAAG